MFESVSSGIEGFDEVIGGGFPRGSFTLLAGNPGTGKTVFSSEFLLEGSRLGEKGVYVSFMEDKERLLWNMKGLGLDLEGAERKGLVKILDLMPTTSGGVSGVLEAILDGISSMGAERLVVDSFSALAQAFKSPIEARVSLQVVLCRLVRESECTTILIDEVPVGGTRLGLGMEEFVADSVIFLRSREVEGCLLRELEILKFRGSSPLVHRLTYTIWKGFKVFPPFRIPSLSLEERKPFKPSPEKPGLFSTGIKALDEILGGGIPKGSTLLLEVGSAISTDEYHLIVNLLGWSFLARGRGVIVIPSSGVTAELVKERVVEGGLEGETVKKLLRVYAPSIPEAKEKEAYIVPINEKDWREGFKQHLKLAGELRESTGQPILHIVGVDTALALVGEEGLERLLNLASTVAATTGSVILLVLKPGYRDLAEKLSAIAHIHLKLYKANGALLLYGVKPATRLYGVEADVSKGYPEPKLTPIQ